MTSVTPDTPTRERLVAAATAVFAERGYEGARVQEIARRAGVTTGAIYANFAGKAELLAEAIGSTPFDEVFALHDHGLSAVETLARAGSLLADASLRGQRLLLFEAFVAARRDPEIAAVLRRQMLARVVRVRGLVLDGNADGTLDAELATDAVVRFCMTLALGAVLAEALDLPQTPVADWDPLVERTLAAFSPHPPKKGTP